MQPTSSERPAIAAAGWTPREGHTDVDLQPSEVEAPAEGVRIATRVLDAANEAPIADALVMVLRPGIGAGAIDVNRLDDQVISWGRSNTYGGRSRCSRAESVLRYPWGAMDPAHKGPSLADLDALPPGIKGEIIEGVLYTMTRPRGHHQRTGLAIGGDLRDPFDRGRGGPGGWWILPEPGIELPNTPEISPDVAGWRRERMPVLPDDAPITVVPDWVCEILSPSTRRHDLLVKKPYYAKVGVAHHWLIDLPARTLTVYRLESGRWVELGVYGDDREARVEPFADVPLDVASWWL